MIDQQDGSEKPNKPSLRLIALESQKKKSTIDAHRRSISFDMDTVKHLEEIGTEKEIRNPIVRITQRNKTIAVRANSSTPKTPHYTQQRRNINMIGLRFISKIQVNENHERKLGQKVVNLSDPEDCEVISHIFEKHKPSRREMQFVVNGLMKLEVFQKCENVFLDLVNNSHCFKEFKRERFGPFFTIFQKGDIGKKFYIVLKDSNIEFWSFEGELFCLIADQRAEEPTINKSPTNLTNSPHNKRLTDFSEGIDFACRTAIFQKMKAQEIPKTQLLKTITKQDTKSPNNNEESVQHPAPPPQLIHLNDKDVITPNEQLQLKQLFPYQKAIKIYRPGEFFGEIALLTSGIRMGTIVCKSDVELISLSRDGFNRIKGAWLESELHKKLSFLRTISFFKDLSDSRLMSVLHMMNVNHFIKGHVLYERSDLSKFIFFLQSGKVEILANLTETEQGFELTTRESYQQYQQPLMKNHQRFKTIPVLSLGPGSYFCFDKYHSHLQGSCITKAVVSSLEADVFAIEISKFEDAMKGFNGNYDYRRDFQSKNQYQSERIKMILELHSQMHQEAKCLIQNSAPESLVPNPSNNPPKKPQEKKDRKFLDSLLSSKINKDKKKQQQLASVFTNNSIISQGEDDTTNANQFKGGKNEDQQNCSNFMLDDEIKQNQGQSQRSTDRSLSPTAEESPGITSRNHNPTTQSSNQRYSNKRRQEQAQELTSLQNYKNELFPPCISLKLSKALVNKQQNLLELNRKGQNLKCIGISPEQVIESCKSKSILIAQAPCVLSGSMKKTLMAITSQGLFAKLEEHNTLPTSSSSSHVQTNPQPAGLIPSPGLSSFSPYLQNAVSQSTLPSSRNFQNSHIREFLDKYKSEIKTNTFEDVCLMSDRPVRTPKYPCFEVYGGRPIKKSSKNKNNASAVVQHTLNTSPSSPSFGLNKISEKSLDKKMPSERHLLNQGISLKGEGQLLRLNPSAKNKALSLDISRQVSTCLSTLLNDDNTSRERQPSKDNNMFPLLSSPNSLNSSPSSRRLVHSRQISYFPETMKKDEDNNNDEGFVRIAHVKPYMQLSSGKPRNQFIDCGVLCQDNRKDQSKELTIEKNDPFFEQQMQDIKDTSDTQLSSLLLLSPRFSKLKDKAPLFSNRSQKNLQITIPNLSIQKNQIK